MEDKNKVTSKTVLIAEDEDTLLQTLSQIFMGEGFRVLGAKDGEIGLDLALKEHPDIILLDLIMPKLSGIDLLRKLREDEWGFGVPVIVLTNLDNKEVAEEAEALGVEDFLVKVNWDMAHIVKLVRTRLGV